MWLESAFTGGAKVGLNDVPPATAVPTQRESTAYLDRALSWSLDHPLTRLTRHLLATLIIVVVAVLRASFITSLLPWLLFLPAIITIALFLGSRPGFHASGLAVISAGVSIGDASEPLFLTGAQWAGSALFLATALGLARLGGELRKAFERARTLAREALDRESFLSSVLASSTDCIKVLDLDGGVTFMSEGGMTVMEVTDFSAVEGCPWPGFWRDAGNKQAVDAIDRARRGEPSHFVGKADTLRGNSRWWDVSVSPIMGANGRPARILSVSRDSTALVEAQEQQRLLNGELGHRLKNVLALVQSIASQTFRRAEDVQSASAAFAARLAALGKATDILTSTAWQSATMRDVIDAGFTSVDGMRDRIELSGPELRLDSQVALALTLALHELTTNACKYGALSNDSGTLTVSWATEPVENGDDSRFSFEWAEHGGPSVVPPSRVGFGSKMIERSLRSYFRGETSLTYDPSGVVFRIDAPLPKAATGMGE